MISYFICFTYGTSSRIRPPNPNPTSPLSKSLPSEDGSKSEHAGSIFWWLHQNWTLTWLFCYTEPRCQLLVTGAIPQNSFQF